MCICHRLTREAHGVIKRCSVGAGGSAIAGSRGHKSVPSSPKEMSSISCPTRWTPLHYRRPWALRLAGRKCLSHSMGGGCRGVVWGRKKGRYTYQARATIDGKLRHVWTCSDPQECAFILARFEQYPCLLQSQRKERGEWTGRMTDAEAAEFDERAREAMPELAAAEQELEHLKAVSSRL